MGSDVTSPVEACCPPKFPGQKEGLLYHVPTFPIPSIQARPTLCPRMGITVIHGPWGQCKHRQGSCLALSVSFDGHSLAPPHGSWTRGGRACRASGVRRKVRGGAGASTGHDSWAHVEGLARYPRVIVSPGNDSQPFDTPTCCSTCRGDIVGPVVPSTGLTLRRSR